MRSDYTQKYDVQNNLHDAFQDKSSDVRKAAENCINEILRVSGSEMVCLLEKCCLSDSFF